VYSHFLHSVLCVVSHCRPISGQEPLIAL